MFIPQEFIRKKRDNQAITKEEITEFITGVTIGEVTDAQISAFTMAVFFNGLTEEELVNLTLAMRDSGEVMNWDYLNAPVVDKHSTGGVGDLVSLILAPAVAAAGGYVPMVVGRGLGHTGGTSDKLEAIPGYNVEPSNEIFKKVVKNIGFAVMGQSKNLAPADKRIYAVRDTTATTESLFLITSSILSKKLASGLHSLIMDVKTGNGAFLENLNDSIELAQYIVNIGKGSGCNTAALITDMNQPLSKQIGNALEIKETLSYLQGNFTNKRLHEINLALGSEMLKQAKLAKNTEEGIKKMLQAINSGRALEKFAQMIAALGGPKDFVEKSNTYLKSAAFIKPVYAKKSGIVSKIATKEIGWVVVALGGGRTNPKDSINHSVGITEMVELGEKVELNQPLAVVHANTESDFLKAEQAIQKAIVIAEEFNGMPSLIWKYIY